MTSRCPDWQTRFAACLAQRWARPFEWGQQDCALFAADGVLACTGVDPAADLRGQYDSALTAMRVLELHGGLAGIAASRLGPEIAPALAQPGDIGLVINDGRECLAVCSGPMWLAPGASGLLPMPAASAFCAWRLP
jgi:hypothetical protein